MNTQDKKLFTAFETAYGSLPGVMAVVEDNLLKDTIFVYVDKEAFKAGSIPHKYQHFIIDLIDAYEQCSALSDAFEKIKEHYQDDLTCAPVTHFEGMINFLKIVIGLYELKLDGEISP